MPCGYDAPRAHAEGLAYGRQLAGLGARQVVAVNASAYFSRPGPRLIGGLELLAHILHPDRFPQAPKERRRSASSLSAQPSERPPRSRSNRTRVGVYAKPPPVALEPRSRRRRRRPTSTRHAREPSAGTL